MISLFLLAFNLPNFLHQVHLHSRTLLSLVAWYLPIDLHLFSQIELIFPPLSTPSFVRSQVPTETLTLGRSLCFLYLDGTHFWATPSPDESKYTQLVHIGEPPKYDLDGARLHLSDCSKIHRLATWTLGETNRRRNLIRRALMSAPCQMSPSYCLSPSLTSVSSHELQFATHISHLKPVFCLSSSIFFRSQQQHLRFIFHKSNLFTLLKDESHLSCKFLLVVSVYIEAKKIEKGWKFIHMSHRFSSLPRLAWVSEIFHLREPNFTGSFCNDFSM